MFCIFASFCKVSYTCCGKMTFTRLVVPPAPLFSDISYLVVLHHTSKIHILYVCRGPMEDGRPPVRREVTTHSKRITGAVPRAACPQRFPAAGSLLPSFRPPKPPPPADACCNSTTAPSRKHQRPG